MRSPTLHFLTPTALDVFFLSCTPSGDAGTSPLDVLSSRRRAPSHSSLWSLSTLSAWPRLVYDTAGGTDGPTRRATHGIISVRSFTSVSTSAFIFQGRTKSVTWPGECKAKSKPELFRFFFLSRTHHRVSHESNSTTQSWDTLHSWRSFLLGFLIRSKAVPSSCVGRADLRELQVGSRPADGATDKWPHMTWRKLLHGHCRG